MDFTYGKRINSLELAKTIGQGVPISINESFDYNKLSLSTDDGTEWSPSNDGRYIVKEYVNKGGFGQVFLGQDTLEKFPVALKISNKSVSRYDLELALEEANFYASISHQNLLKILDFTYIKDEEDYIPVLVLEYLEGESLSRRDLSKYNLSNEEKLEILEGISDGFDYILFGLGRLHKDITPGNIILIKGKKRGYIPKIIDGGFSRPYDPAATPGYAAPELIRERKSSTESEVWSFVATMFKSVCGRSPFGDFGPTRELSREEQIEFLNSVCDTSRFKDITIQEICFKNITEKQLTKINNCFKSVLFEEINNIETCTDFTSEIRRILTS